MKNIALFVVSFFIISCSDSDKFSGEKNQQIRIEGIDYEVYYGELYLLGILQSEIVNNCWIINGKYSYVSLKNLGTCYLSDYLWIIDNAGYGEYLVKLVLVDTFGDSISDSAYIKINEPFKITLLSPVENYKASKTDTLSFQYHISGIDTWEDTVYISTDENVLENKALLWENGKAMENKFLEPPLNELVYYWGIKVSTQDTAFYSEIRSVWIKN